MDIHIEALHENSYDPALIGEIARVDTDAFGDPSLTPWATEAFLRHGMVFGLYDQNRLIGDAQVMVDIKDRQKAYVLGLAIESTQQNKGYGTLLLQEVINYLIAHGFKTLDLHVKPSNYSAVHVYGDLLGFKSIDYRLNEYGDGDVRILMQKNFILDAIDERLSRISEVSRKLSLNLRLAYFNQEPKVSAPYKVPFGGTAKGSLGPWPEFIIKTFPCAKTMRGFCTPCFFSKIPLVDASKAEIFESLSDQLDFVLNDFQKQVLDCQERQVDFPNLAKQFPEGKSAIMCIACNGSFFSNSEATRGSRKEAIERIHGAAKTNKANLQVFIEACSEDIIQANRLGEIKELGPVLKELNAGILLGFESRDEISRNVLWNKSLPLHQFEMSVEIIKEAGLIPGAFVFPGLHSMTYKEIINDVKNTLIYLKKLGVMPVLMFTNLKRYTIPDLLNYFNRFNIPDPRVMLDIIEFMTDLLPFDPINRSDPWLMSDPIPGQPYPHVHMFSNPRKISCDKCSETILYAIDQLRRDYDRDKFMNTVAETRSCECATEYYAFLESTEEQKTPLIDRVEANINFAEANYKDYVREIEGLAQSE